MGFVASRHSPIPEIDMPKLILMLRGRGKIHGMSRRDIERGAGLKDRSLVHFTSGRAAARPGEVVYRKLWNAVLEKRWLTPDLIDECLK